MSRATKSDMLTEMQADLDRSAAADVTAMGLKIDAAIAHYQPMRFYFNESRAASFNTVAGTNGYTYTTIGTTFYKIDGVFLTENATTILPLEQVDYRIVERDRLLSNALPYGWALMGQTLYLTLTPDDAYATRVMGHVKLAGPATDGEADNAWMTDAYDLIMARAKSEFYAAYFDNNSEMLQMAQVMRIAEQDALAQLRKASADRASSGQLAPTAF